MIHQLVRDLSCEPNIYLSLSTSEIRMRLVPSSKKNTDCSKAVLLLCILFVIYATCLSCFLVWPVQPSGHLLGKGWPLGSLVCDVFLCVFVIFPFGVPGQVWYLIASIPDFCLLTYFVLGPCFTV